MIMTENEIVREYREAKNPSLQVQIIADLNECGKQDILEILYRKGCLTEHQVKIYTARGYKFDLAESNAAAEATPHPPQAVPLPIKGEGTDGGSVVAENKGAYYGSDNPTVTAAPCHLPLKGEVKENAVTKETEVTEVSEHGNTKRIIEIGDQEAKADAGKRRLTLAPRQIIRDIAEVREHGVVKYPKPDSWKTVSIERYSDALFRHLLAFLDDPYGVDEESGIEHYKHMACNMAFICELMEAKNCE